MKRGTKSEAPLVDRDHLSEMATYFNDKTRGTQDWLFTLAKEKEWGPQTFALMSGMLAIMAYHGENWMHDHEMFNIVLSRIIEYLDRMSPSPPGTFIQSVKDHYAKSRNIGHAEI
jgi:hypothetical protein